MLWMKKSQTDKKTHNGASQEFFNEKNLSDSFSIVVKDGHCCHQRIAFSIRYKARVRVSVFECECECAWLWAREKKREIVRIQLHILNIFFKQGGPIDHFFRLFSLETDHSVAATFFLHRHETKPLWGRKGIFISFHLRQMECNRGKNSAYFFRLEFTCDGEKVCCLQSISQLHKIFYTFFFSFSMQKHKK